MIAILIVLSVGVIVFLFGLAIYILDIQSKKWNKTIGTITHAGLKEKTSTDSEGRLRLTYKADLKYSYQSNDKTKYIVGTQLFPYVDVWTSNKKEKVAIVEKLKKGNVVNVFYNPKNPSKSCLITGSNYYTKYFISAGVAFIIFALVFWIYELSEDLNLVLNQITEK